MRDSIFTRARNARTGSDDLATYCNNMAPITFKVGFQLFVVALVALMMAIGITHLNECPINCLIPIYLIATGGLYIGWLVLEMGCEQCDFPNIKLWLRILLSLSAVGFFIAGNIWVYGAWEEVETRKRFLNNDEYCNPWVYWVAFCTITINTALTIIGLFSLMAWCLLACCIKLCCKGVIDETTPLTAARSDSPA
ncbi:uncharacterized protein LOC134815653 [Bolinopsis microptera]|uniref:uncharacterized protein LOC134815653 n=1 Tax=Bolinopsis microptera TaxID=2820187 RepID=UPI00307AE5F2